MSWFQIGLQIAGGLLAGAVGAWITAAAALRRFRSEQYWTKRVEAYENIIQALHNRKISAERTMYVFMSPHDEDELLQQERLELGRNAAQEIQRATDMGSFLISEEAHAVLVQCESNLRKAAKDRPSGDTVGLMADEVYVLQECLRKFVKVTKGDLNWR